MEALDIGPGDEVIVPGLTWVACASSVANLNATPVLADIDPSTLCLDVDAVRAAITDRTKAVMVVHLYSAVADLGKLLELCSQHGLHLIEDCAQAHGARWHGQRVGSHGAVGTFSMQNGKVLTAGEGGAVTTSDSALATRVLQLVSDGRRLRTAPIGEMELVEDGIAKGNNGCISELQAAILLQQLGDLDEQHSRRARAAAFLDSELTALGLEPQKTTPGTTARTYYQYAICVPGLKNGRRALEEMCRALSAELQIQISPAYRPLNANPLYQPSHRRRWNFSADCKERLRLDKFNLVSSAKASNSFLTIPHGCLLGSSADIESIVTAFKKVLTQRIH